MNTLPWGNRGDGFVSHSLLRPQTVEYRQYQVNIAGEALRGNTLVVIPTGLGKTIIGSLVLAEVLHKFGGRALILAPSKPLADQHARRLRALLRAGRVACITGAETPKKRANRWGSARILTCTPQVAWNDLRKGLLPLDISVVVFDEAHRAVGDYAYVALAKGLRTHCPTALFLGLTASPGHELERIEEVKAHLFIEQVQTRTEEDPDVAPYVQEAPVEWVEVQPSEVITKVSGYLTKYTHGEYNQVRKWGYLRHRKNTQVRIQDLTEVQGLVYVRMRRTGNKAFFQVLRHIGLAMLGDHARMRIEREGVDAFLKFMDPKMVRGRSKLDASFVKDPKTLTAYNAARKWRGPMHPKRAPLVEVVARQLRSKPRSKVMVFAELRDTVDLLVDLLGAKGFTVERFTGQGGRGGQKGMTQKQQRGTLLRFGRGEFQVLCATSIGEEGLDIPQVDLVVFYEPVPSAIRLIQRKGRTGRDAPGRVIILTTNQTIDQGYLWAGVKREKKMKRLVRQLADAPPRPTLSLNRMRRGSGHRAG